MNETILNVGNFLLDQYLKPAPKIAVKAVLTSWIGTTVGLIIGGIIVAYRNKKAIS